MPISYNTHFHCENWLRFLDNWNFKVYILENHSPKNYNNWSLESYLITTLEIRNEDIIEIQEYLTVANNFMASGELQSIIHVKLGDAVCEADNNCLFIVCTK